MTSQPEKKYNRLETCLRRNAFTIGFVIGAPCFLFWILSFFIDLPFTTKMTPKGPEISPNNQTVKIQPSKEMKDILEKGVTISVKFDDAFSEKFVKVIVPEAANNLKPLVTEIVDSMITKYTTEIRKVEIEKSEFENYIKLTAVAFQSQVDSIDKEKSDIFAEKNKLEREIRDNNEELNLAESELETANENISFARSKISELTDKKKSNCDGLFKSLGNASTCGKGNRNLDAEIIAYKNDLRNYESEKTQLENRIEAIASNNAMIEEQIASFGETEQTLLVKYNNLIAINNNIKNVKFENFASKREIGNSL